MLPDRVLNPGPLTYESGALPIALRSPASIGDMTYVREVTKLTQFAYFLLYFVVLLFYVHGKHLRSCRDGQLT